MCVAKELGVLFLVSDSSPGSSFNFVWQIWDNRFNRDRTKRQVE